MPEGSREPEEVHLVALEHVLHDRAVFDHHGRHRLALVHAPLPLVHQLPGADLEREPERDGEPAALALGVDQDAIAARIPGDVVEEDGGGLVGVLEHLGDAADVVLPVHAVEDAQLAGGVDHLQPVPQVLVRHAAPHFGEQRRRVGRRGSAQPAEPDGLREVGRPPPLGGHSHGSPHGTGSGCQFGLIVLYSVRRRKGSARTEGGG